MGKKKGKGKPKTSDVDNGLIFVDPARVRFQHSRIRPYFSGCGRSVHETLDAMREGKIQPSDIPPIQVSLFSIGRFSFPLENSYSHYVHSGSGGTRNRGGTLVFFLEQSSSVGI